MFDISPQTIAVMIPVVAVLGIFAVAVVAVLKEGKIKELRQQERIIAMEKGLPIPEEIRKIKQPRYLAVRAWGLVFASIGIAVFFGILAEAGFRHAVWGFVPLAIGTAMIIAARLEKRDWPGND